MKDRTKHSSSSNTLGKFLTEMQGGFGKMVFAIGCTNNPEAMGKMHLTIHTNKTCLST
jgi:hypothetical protein